MSEQAPQAGELRSVSKKPRLIAVIGVGAVLPGARNVPEFWQNVQDGRDSVIEVPKDRWDTAVFYDPDPNAEDKSYCKTAGVVIDLPFDERNFRVPPHTLASMDRSQKMLITAVFEAMRDSGYDRKPFDRARTAVVMGNASGRTEGEAAAALRIQVPLAEAILNRKLSEGGFAPEAIQKLLEEWNTRMLDRQPPINEDTLSGVLRNVAAGRVASCFNLQGPSYIVDSACASGLAAIDFATEGLVGGDYDLVLSGGFHGALDPLFFVSFSKFRGLSTDRVKPFDATAEGFVPGEGACALLLKRLEDAVRDGDRIYAVLRGIGSSSDGRQKGIGAPNPKAQALSMRRAFEQAGYPPETVQFVETHGAATPIGDVSEFQAMREVFGDKTGLRLSAVKSQVGHLMGAAGAVGALKTILGLYHKVLPPTINHVEPSRNLPWQETGFRMVLRPEPWAENHSGLPRRANVSAFGFGGTNFHAAFEEYVPSFHASLLAPAREGARVFQSPERTPTAGPDQGMSPEVRHPQEPVAVIGLGAALPNAFGVDAVWDMILNRANGIREMPEDRWERKTSFFLAEDGIGPKTQSLLAGFIDPPDFDPRPFRIPPGTARAMDPMQKLFMQTALMALSDAGYADGRPFDRQRTAVLVGGAPGCQSSVWSCRIRSTALEAEHHLRMCKAADAIGLRGEALNHLLDEFRRELIEFHPPMSEDTPLSVCVQIGAARFAKALDLMGPHCNIDAACASSLASTILAVKGLQSGKWDLAITGGVSEGYTPLIAVLFSKASVISSHGSRPFDTSADGFVPGEGSVVFVLKRLSEALRDGDRIYAVIRGGGASTDGKGRAAMAPRPEGQTLCLERAYEDAGYGPETVDLVECHGTSTAVGDVVELKALRSAFGNPGQGRIGVGSIKSQVGHLVGASGSAGLLKAVLGLHHRIMPPTINVTQSIRALQDPDTPFYLLTEAKEWEKTRADVPRRAAVSSFGFGGTNWHLTLEEFDPAYHRNLIALLAEPAGDPRRQVTPGAEPDAGVPAPSLPPQSPPAPRSPEPRIFAFAAGSSDELLNQIDSYLARLGDTGQGDVGQSRPGDATVIGVGDAPVRLAVVAAGVTELRTKIGLVRSRVKEPRTPAVLEAQGIYLGKASVRDSNGKLCFLFPGQGPQYADMWRQLAAQHAEVKETFDEANRTLLPLLGTRLEELVFTSGSNTEAVEQTLMNSEIVQPALLTANIAMYRLLRSRGLDPDLVAGHSLGEYSALVASGVLDLASALRAVHVRGREFRRLSEGEQDPGLMAMITAPVTEIEPVLSQVSGYVVVANKNCALQTVISGASTSVRQVVEMLERQGLECRVLPIAGAFHSAIARAIVPAMEEVLNSLRYSSPQIPVLSSVTCEYYDSPDIKRQAVGNLIAQLSGPVDFIGLVNRLYADGSRTFLEVGPKKALSGFVDEILTGRPHTAVYSNHPKVGEKNQLNRALAQFFALGYSIDFSGSARTSDQVAVATAPISQERIEVRHSEQAFQRRQDSKHRERPRKIVISGASVGLPGRNRQVFSDEGILQLLAGHSLIDALNSDEQDLIVDKNILRLVKAESGDSYFERIDDRKGAIKLAARRGQFQLADFGLDQDWLQRADVTDQIAVAAGIEGLKDAGIPLQRSYRQTTTGRSIPTGWLLPESLRDDTGVIFASIYSGLDKVLGEVSRYYKTTLGPLAAEGLRALYQEKLKAAATPEQRLAADQWFAEEIRKLRLPTPNGPYEYDRDLTTAYTCKGNALFAQLVGARGPNLHVNSACASHCAALGVAEDMVRAGRARRVIVLAADDVTSDRLLEWMGAGFLALGAAATDPEVCDAVLPFDRRRHGLVLGMGASAIVVETEEAALERGIKPIAELLGVHVSNSAFHLTRLYPEQIAGEMDAFLDRLDDLHGLTREELAAKTLFMSHETYTPARGGSAQAEAEALKAAFGPSWQKVLVANTKGMTGHCQGAGIEDVVALKSLQFGVVPPIANFREHDPELHGLNLSRGGRQELDFALGFAAGFGSHVSMFLARSIARGTDRISDPALYSRWLGEATGLSNPKVVVDQRTLRVEDGDRTAVAEAAQAEPAAPPERIAEPGSPTPVPSYRPAQGAPPGGGSGVPVQVAESAKMAPPEPLAPVAIPVRVPEPSQLSAPPATAPTEQVQELVLRLFEEKTGYERELLDLDLDLEADLGIDTIKQAQIFAAVRDKYGLAREEGVRLKDYPTLRHVIDYIASRTSPASAAVAPQPAPAPPTAAPATDGSVAREPQASGLYAPLQAAASTPSPQREPAPAPAGQGIVPASPTGDHVLDTVLRMVEEKTGYERELLELDLDLEADLGIDTIKQAQILGAIREHFNLPREEGVRLKDYPTLRHVIGYISSRVTSSAAAQPAVQAPEPAPVRKEEDDRPPAAATHSTTASTAAADVAVHKAAELDLSDDVRETVLSLVEEKTGYERQFLDLDLDLEADLGIDTIKQAQIFALVRDRYQLPREEGVRLKDFPTLRLVIAYISRRLQEGSGAAESAEVETVASQPVTTEVSGLRAKEETVVPLVDQPRTTTVPPGATGADNAPRLGASETPPPTASRSDVQDVVLRLVEEKTGYERELLDLDLDLEADLGIDTIKQAQIFALVRDRYQLPREEGVHLKDFPTLRKVIEYISRRVESAAAASSPVPEPAVTSAPQMAQPARLAPTGAGASTTEGSNADEDPALIAAGPSTARWTEVRRWSIICPSTPARSDQAGIKLSPGSLFVLTDDGTGVAQAVKRRLASLGVKSLLLTDGKHPTGQADFAADFEDPVRVKQVLEEMRARVGPIDGLIHLIPLGKQASVEQMTLAEWRATTARETKSLHALAKALINQQGAGNRPRALAAATCMGGRFGFSASPEESEMMAGPPSHGAVAGFVKALSREKPEPVFKVIDLDRKEATSQPDVAAATLVNELLSGDGSVEVGFRKGVRSVPRVCYRPLDLSRTPHIELGKDSVVLLFGGARGITGEIAKDLAERFGCRLILAGTTPLAALDIAAVANLNGDQLPRYRRQVFDQMRKGDPKVTPARAEVEVQKQLRAAEIHRTLGILRGFATDVVYEVCDVRDAVRMEQLFDNVSGRFGRLDGVVFGSGVIEDKLLEDKTEESFSRVFDVKADGVFNLYHALKSRPELKPSFVASFSSVAGRFGNRGQTDYSAANELLAKFTHEFVRLLPEVSCFTIDWTAWSEVGLPARSGLAAMMKEQGLDLLDPAQGAEAFHNELLFGTGQEALYAGRLPGYTDGGDAPDFGSAAFQGELPDGIAPMLGDVTEYHPGASLTVRKTIDPATDRWLADHVIDGVPLVPGVVGIEMIAEAGRLLFPEFHFIGLDDLRIHLAVKILKNRPVDLKISAQAHTAKHPNQRLILVRIESDFIGPQGQPLGETRLHYEATVIMSRGNPARSQKPSLVSKASVDRELAETDIYGKGKLLPHGPAFSVLRAMKTLEDKSAVGSVAPVSETALCPTLNGHTLSTLPLAREAGFQVAGLWAMLKPGIVSLPHGCRRLRNFGLPPQGMALLAKSANFKVSGDAIECDVEIVGEDGVVYDRMEGYYAVPVGRFNGK